MYTVHPLLHPPSGLTHRHTFCSRPSGPRPQRQPQLKYPRRAATYALVVLEIITMAISSKGIMRSLEQATATPHNFQDRCLHPPTAILIYAGYRRARCIHSRKMAGAVPARLTPLKAIIRFESEHNIDVLSDPETSIRPYWCSWKRGQIGLYIEGRIAKVIDPTGKAGGITQRPNFRSTNSIWRNGHRPRISNEALCRETSQVYSSSAISEARCRSGAASASEDFYAWTARTAGACVWKPANPLFNDSRVSFSYIGKPPA